MSKEKRRVPKLRFPGFTEDWEQRKLESILIEYIEKNPGNENLPVLTSSRQGLTKQEDHFGSVQRHDISDYNVIPLGFCTYRNRSDDKTFTFNINRIVPRGLVSKFYPVFEIKNGNADFITEYLNNNTEIIKSLATNAVGTSQVVLSLRTLRNIEITLPLKEEQVAIGDLMRKLDIYITLHQRKLDNLKLKKKALLQKLFPKNGERYPELRFPGFTDAWEQRKLEDVCNVYDGTHQTPRYTNSGVMFVSVEDIETLESNKYITEEDFKSEFKVFPEYGDILLTRIGDVGSANVILDEIKRAYYVSLALLKPKDINSLFLLALLSSSSVQSEIWRRTLHIAFPKKINKNEINKVIVNQPSIPEQEKIGKLFFSLDQTITLHQRKLDHLQLQKKALLQQMFV